MNVFNFIMGIVSVFFSILIIYYNPINISILFSPLFAFVGGIVIVDAIYSEVKDGEEGK